MHEQSIWKIPKQTIPITRPHFGASTDELPTQRGSGHGDPYYKITEECYRLLARKRNYYGCAADPLENALGVMDQGIQPWLYQVARIGEKIRRTRGNLTDNDLTETLFDIMGHAAVAIATIRRLASSEQEGKPGDAQS